jgi:CHAT domain-containing protein
MIAERHWIRGMSLLALGQPMESLQAYNESLTEFELVGDEEYAGAVHSLLAENLATLGDDGRAWQEREDSIATLAHFHDSQRQEVALNEAAEAALSQDLPDVALLFQDEVVNIARNSEDHLLRAYALMWRGLIETRLNMTADARKDLADALTEVELIEDRDAKSRTRADLEMAAGVAEPTQTKAAIDHYTSALEYYDAHEYRFRSAQLRLARGRALIRNSKPQEALADFYAGMDEVERYGHVIDEDRARSLFYGRTSELFSEALQLVLDGGDYMAALRVAERGRERALATNLAPNVSAATRDAVSLLQRNLDGKSVVIVFAVTPRETVGWAISASSIAYATVPLGQMRLSSLVDQFRQSIEKGSPERDELGAKLYQVLFARLHSVKHYVKLTVIPDGPLSDLPYAALRAPGGLYLIEAVERLTTAPSIQGLLGCRELLLRRSHKAGPHTLVFGASHFQSPELQDLPGVRTELFEVAQSHRKAELLFEEAATSEAFRGRAPKADIIHFAGHAVLNPVDPTLSFLLFGPSSGIGSRILYVHDIASMTLRARVVVLSACGTALRSHRRPEGVSSVARAFYRAGVPAVVATLGDVGDRSAASIMSLLHGDLERGIEPAVALRSAQVAMIHSSSARDRDPRTWAAYEVIGL